MQTTFSLAAAHLFEFDFSKSVQANADNVINIHESSSSLILSAFYIVLISRIRIIIIIIIIIISIIISIIVSFSQLFFFFLQKHCMTKKAPPTDLSSVKMTNMHSYMVTKF